MIYSYLAAVPSSFELRNFEGMTFLQMKDDDDVFVVWRKEDDKWRFDFFGPEVKMEEGPSYNRSELFIELPATNENASYEPGKEYDEMEALNERFEKWIEDCVSKVNSD